MAKRAIVLGQDKDYKGKLSKPVVENVIEGFKENIEGLENAGKKVAGCELNGGKGMTKGAQEAWDDFSEEMDNNDKFAIYNTNEEINKIRETLRNRNKNKNKNKN